MQDPLGDQEKLEVLKEDRDINKEVCEGTKEEITALVEQEEDIDVMRLMELRYIVEPTIREIEHLDKKVQGMMKKLRFKRDLVNELKQCRSYYAKNKIIMEKVKELEASGKGKFNGMARQQTGGRKEISSPQPLFHIGADRIATGSNRSAMQPTDTVDSFSHNELFGMPRMPMTEQTSQIHRPENYGPGNFGSVFARQENFGMGIRMDNQRNQGTGWEWPTSSRGLNADLYSQNVVITTSKLVSSVFNLTLTPYALSLDTKHYCSRQNFES